MGFAKMFSMLRKNRGLTQAQLAEELKISRSALGMYEQGRREPDRETLEKIADYFNVDMNTLFEVDTESFSDRGKNVKLLGAAGCSPGASLPILEDIVCPSFIGADCAFVAKGDSMISQGIQDGDIVYIKTGYVQDNKIGCVRIGDEYLLKKIQREGDRIHLQSDIPMITISGEQEDAEIVGKVVYILHAVN